MGQFSAIIGRSGFTRFYESTDTSEKIRILRAADACAAEKGAVTSLLRREGLYSSHLTSWRRQRDVGQLGSSPRKRGPVAVPPDPRDKQIAELEYNLRRAEARAAPIRPAAPRG